MSERGRERELPRTNRRPETRKQQKERIARRAARLPVAPDVRTADGVLPLNPGFFALRHAGGAARRGKVRVVKEKA